MPDDLAEPTAKAESTFDSSSLDIGQFLEIDGLMDQTAFFTVFSGKRRIRPPSSQGFVTEPQRLCRARNGVIGSMTILYPSCPSSSRDIPMDPSPASII
jgi:hypothetical protein